MNADRRGRRSRTSELIRLQAGWASELVSNSTRASPPNSSLTYAKLPGFAGTRTIGDSTTQKCQRLIPVQNAAITAPGQAVTNNEQTKSLMLVRITLIDANETLSGLDGLEDVAGSLVISDHSTQSTVLLTIMNLVAIARLAARILG
jgi:hypothetical protein